jgi:hypothetical protein
MFPLHTKDFPATADALAKAINDSLARVLILARDSVSVTATMYPEVDALTVTLDGAQIRGNVPRVKLPSGETKPALHVATLVVGGRRISSSGAAADLHLQARDVRFNRASDSSGNIVLVVESAAEGSVEVTASKRAIEAVITQVATAQAAKHGVSIDDVRLTATSRNTRTVDAEVQLRARKLFFNAAVRISASLAIDDELTAKVSGLTCSGDGPIGSLACTILNPHLQQMNGREIPLMALPLGGIRLRDVQLAAGDELKVSAQFGVA